MHIIVVYITRPLSSIRIVELFDPDSRPYGLSYEEHIIKDWKQNLSTPIDKSPMEDKTGERTFYGSDPNSPLVYLSRNSGGSTERNCKVRSGVGCFISVGDAVYSEGEKPGSTVEQLQALPIQDQDNATDVFLKIDDQEFNFEDLNKYRFHTGEFDVEFPQNALFGARPGHSKAAADGYYVITKPLSPGKHTIITKMTVSEPP